MCLLLPYQVYFIFFVYCSHKRANLNIILQVIAIDNVSHLEDIKHQYGITDNILTTELSETQLLIPGLIDTHIHAPQYPNAGLGYDKQLLDWLHTYTFPLEERYKEIKFAKKVYNAVVVSMFNFKNITLIAFIKEC